jgi:hypothetical protein
VQNKIVLHTETNWQSKPQFTTLYPKGKGETADSIILNSHTLQGLNHNQELFFSHSPFECLDINRDFDCQSVSVSGRNGVFTFPFEYMVVNGDLCYNQSVLVPNKIYFENSEKYKRKLIKMFASHYIIP